LSGDALRHDNNWCVTRTLLNAVAWTQTASVRAQAKFGNASFVFGSEFAWLVSYCEPLERNTVLG
jgi:hypothetical protein